MKKLVLLYSTTALCVYSMQQQKSLLYRLAASKDLTWDALGMSACDINNPIPELGDKTLLQWAIDTHNNALFDFCLKNGADVMDIYDETTEETILHLAAKRTPSVMRAVLERIPTDEKDNLLSETRKDGKTALAVAQDVYRNFETAEVLRAHGAPSGDAAAANQ